MVVITLNFSVIMISIYRSLLCQLDYTKDSTLHLRTLFVMWYILSPLSSASSSSLSGVFNNNNNNNKMAHAALLYIVRKATWKLDARLDGRVSRII